MRALSSVGTRGGSLALLAGLLTVGPVVRPSWQSRDVILATTTSTRDTGLLDYLLPIFEKLLLRKRLIREMLI